MKVNEHGRTLTLQELATLSSALRDRMQRLAPSMYKKDKSGALCTAQYNQAEALFNMIRREILSMHGTNNHEDAA